MVVGGEFVGGIDVGVAVVGGVLVGAVAGPSEDATGVVVGESCWSFVSLLGSF